MENDKEVDVSNVEEVNTVENPKQNIKANLNQKSIKFFVPKRISKLKNLRRDSVPIISGQLAFRTTNSDGKENRKRGRSKLDGNQSYHGFVPRVFPRGKKIGTKTVQDEELEKRTNCEGNTEESGRSPKAKKQKSRDTKGNKESFADENNENKENEKENEENEDDYSWHEEDINTFDKYLVAAKKNGKIKKCIDCNKNYCAEYNNKTNIRCLLCNSNSHGCIKEELCKADKPCETSKGFVWLCTQCRDFIESKDTDFSKNLREEIMKNSNKEKHMENEKKRLLEYGKKTGKNKSSNSNTKVDQNDEIISPISKTLEEKSTNDGVILNYHGSNIRETDLKTLEGKNWINDTIISFFFEHLQRVTFGKNKQLLFVSPAATQILKAGENRDLPVILNPLGALHKEYIFFPVNNNETVDRVGGTHWSLLVYNKNVNTWIHLDSQRDLNNVHARQLMNRVNTYMNGKTPPKYVETNCTQQNNGYDCGAFTMMHAQETAKRALEKLPIANCVINRIVTNKMRSVIHDLINIEIHMLKKKQNVDINKGIENNPTENERICHYWRRNRCKKGDKCLFKHPELCEAQIKTGKCQDYFTNICMKYHPIICLKNMKKESCKYGERCWFRHINKETVNEYTQQQTKKLNELKEANPRNLHSIGDRKWQNSNSFDERNNHEYHQYDKHQHTSHQNERYNHQYEYNHSDNTYIDKNQLDFLERYDYNRQHTTQAPQIPYGQLKQVIQAVIHEMNNTY